jgi:hypothetical protein
VAETNSGLRLTAVRQADRRADGRARCWAGRLADGPSLHRAAAYSYRIGSWHRQMLVNTACLAGCRPQSPSRTPALSTRNDQPRDGQRPQAQRRVPTRDRAGGRQPAVNRSVSRQSVSTDAMRMVGPFDRPNCVIGTADVSRTDHRRRRRRCLTADRLQRLSTYSTGRCLTYVRIVFGAVIAWRRRKMSRREDRSYAAVVSKCSAVICRCSVVGIAAAAELLLKWVVDRN